MSIRTLIEINHDYTWDMTPEFLANLQGYLSGGSTRCRDALEAGGIRIISQRHHSSDFYFDPAQVSGFGRLTLKEGYLPEVAHPKERDHD